MSSIRQVLIEDKSGVIGLNWFINPHIYVRDGHLVLCEGTCLVGANVISTTHDLTRCKFLDKVLVNEHLFHGEGESNHDG